MAETRIPQYDIYRRRTRTYDAPSNNIADVIKALAGAIVPPGTYIPTALTTEPEGDFWKLCDGQALSKADFPTLFSVFGSQYGEDATTFNLPDWRGRIPRGADGTVALGALAGAASVTLTLNQIPAHSHGVTDPGHSHGVTDPGHDHLDEIAGSHVELIDMGVDTVPSYDATARTSTETTGISIDSATTGISIDSVGGGESIDITPPVFGVNWLVKT